MCVRLVSIDKKVDSHQPWVLVGIKYKYHTHSHDCLTCSASVFLLDSRRFTSVAVVAFVSWQLSL